MKDEEAMSAMTKPDLTLTNHLRRLAEAERQVSKSSCALGAFHAQYDAEGQVCPECEFGYRRVPLFRNAQGEPLFRKACPPMLHSSGDGSVLFQHGCGGLGWLPLSEAEATIDKVTSVATRFTLSKGLGTEWWCYLMIGGPTDPGPAGSAEAETPRLACYRALVAAMQQEPVR